jgi:8-oxo-dGTP diphosphatase
MTKSSRNKPNAGPQIDHLRKNLQPNNAIGGVDYVGVGVGAMVFDDHGRVFVAQRGPATRNERGCWEFPGGAVQFGEELQKAITREFIEEYGMVIELQRLLCVTDHILRDEAQHWVSVCFLGRHVSGRPTVRESEKCLDIRWAALDTLPTPLTQASTSYLRDFRIAFGRKLDDKAFSPANMPGCLDIPIVQPK